MNEKTLKTKLIMSLKIMTNIHKYSQTPFISNKSINNYTITHKKIITANLSTTNLLTIATKFLKPQLEK